MSDPFVPLTVLLRPPASAPERAVAREAAAPEPPAPPGTNDPACAECAVAFGAARRFRAALLDALDVAVEQLLEEIAENVLARELRCASADLASIVAKARERLDGERILAVRLHPLDLDALGELEIEPIADASLGRGDVIAELRSGTIDLRLRTRLGNAFAAVREQ